MIVFNKDLLFVHNPKTAGTSIISYLRKTLHPPVYTAGVTELGTNHPHLALALGYACAITKNRPEDFKIILSVLRDPYAREISMYTYYRDHLSTSPTVEADLNDPEMLEAVRASSKLPFRPYLRWLVQTYGTCDIWHSRYYYELESGTKPNNLFIARMEDLKSDIGRIIDGLGRSEAQHDSLEHLNRTQHDHSSLYFDGETEKIVFNDYGWIFSAGYYSRLTAAEHDEDPARREYPVLGR